MPVVTVISDLHVGAGVLDDCDAELERGLVAFLKELAARQEPIELVFNGDFLDFAQAPPWEGRELESTAEGSVGVCFTEEQSIAKLDAIIGSHPAIFEALRDFLGGSSFNRLVILPGNHDADLFWPGVRARLAAAIAEAIGDRLVFHLERAYRSPAFPHVWIEHGHQYDPLNCFFVAGVECWSAARPPILRDMTGHLRLYECIGTRFLIRFLNRLDAEYPFVDNVKPFSRFIRLFAASTLEPGHGPLKVAVAMWSLVRYLTNSLVATPGDILTLEEGIPAADLLLEPYRRLPPSSQRNFDETIRARGFALDRPLELYVSTRERAEALLEFLAGHLELFDSLDAGDAALLGVGVEPGTLSLVRGFNVNETAELLKGAAKLLEHGDTRAVVMGHTHEPVDRPAGVPYFNTGSWTRYYRFAPREHVTTWSILQTNSYEHFPYQLNYAEISGAPPGDVRLITFRERDRG
jgi:UDP-2,3-diacylglucosamine pyrophosphatase LpxH